MQLISARDARTIENCERTLASACLSPAARPCLSVFPGLAFAVIASLVVAGCTVATSEAPSPVAVETSASIPRERLIGRWGIASYHADKDRPRTEREARAQCGQPYTIAKGPTDGVMMHVADDPKPYELRLKGDAAGRTYLGFEAPPGHPQDREILSSTSSLMTMRFVDPDANRRYGTFVYVRCGA
ncbi:hypothetical protein HPT29_000105 [Microvirga terrae]|uniref:Lipoprotein n=1 Tax=Microvirga terrae TaxID=2740529 RepID=A0ABY5RTQ9_9HYPH|nr:MULTISPECIES: hypothetical protein [Microvirga]UVF19602.1 hypothetical protein HPT29_000105 [Microvirga terrae]